VAPGQENTGTLVIWSNLANFAPIPVPGTLTGTMQKVANLRGAHTLKVITAKSSIFMFS
jgi:hypothetical protein